MDDDDDDDDEFMWGVRLIKPPKRTQENDMYIVFCDKWKEMEHDCFDQPF